MKIALFSDVHANLPALEAVLKDIDRQNPYLVFCLGDLVGYAPFPNEVVQEIRRRKIPTLAGNYDEGIGLGSGNCGCAYKTEEDKSNGAVSIAFTDALIGKEEREYLRHLPRHMALEFEVRDRKIKLLMVHGSPRKINEYLFEDREEKSLLRILESAEADILCFGHTHKPYHRVLPNEDGTYRHAVNLGSVGKPKDGDPRACYVLLTLSPEYDTRNPELDVSFVRVEYPVEQVAQAVEDSPLPDIFADMLRKAY